MILGSIGFESSGVGATDITISLLGFGGGSTMLVMLGVGRGRALPC